jgi:hypothetical protein
MQVLVGARSVTTRRLAAIKAECALSAAAFPADERVISRLRYIVERFMRIQTYTCGCCVLNEAVPASTAAAPCDTLLERRPAAHTGTHRRSAVPSSTHTHTHTHIHTQERERFRGKLVPRIRERHASSRLVCLGRG